MPNSLASTAEYSLHQTWQDWKAKSLFDPQACQQLAKRANSVGEHLLAIEIAERALENVGDADPIPLLQQKALALARSAATSQALQTLEQIRARGGENAETFGMLGRVYKDLAEGTSDKDERLRFLQRSQELYQAGFEHSQGKDAFCGINAAAVAVLTGNLELARDLAVQAANAPSQHDLYYDLATKAEAALILKRPDEAADLYRQACAAGPDRWADIVSTRNQCRKLAKVLYKGERKFDECFPLGAVAIFAGHMIDGPNRAMPRFPASAEESVQERIMAWLQDRSISLSYSSAASGSDLIFLEAAQSLGVRTHIVLPFAVEKFIETSVRPGGEHWVERFEQSMSRAISVTIINDDVADDASSAYDFTNRMIAAKAMLRAKLLYLDEAIALCVWNGLPGDGGGGTADAVTVWSEAKLEARVIDPLSFESAKRIEATNVRTSAPFARTRSALRTGESKRMACAVMHLYFEGYFSLRENEYPAFQQKVLGTLATTLAVTNFPPVSRYGLGPDYVFVFEMPKAAGMMAIEALDALSAALRGTEGLSIPMPRACLHAGIVQLMVNPILNQYTHEGTSLTRAGRLVRNVEPGVAYCTEPFAALSALDAIDVFRCEPAGTARYADGTQDRLFSVRYQQKPQV